MFLAGEQDECSDPCLWDADEEGLKESHFCLRGAAGKE